MTRVVCRSPLEPGSLDKDHYSWGDDQKHGSLASSTSQPQQTHKQRLRLPKELPDSASMSVIWLCCALDLHMLSPGSN